MSPAETRELAHKLIDRMAPGQVAAVVGLLEVMVDPVARAIANAPYDDEPVSDEDLRDIAESRASFRSANVTSNEELLAEFGLTTEDFERMGRTPLEHHGSDR
jgi:hypothetical protein